MRICLLLFLVLSFNCASQNSPAPINLVDILLTPDHADWIYHTGEEAEVLISVLKFGVPVQGAEISYEFGPELLEPEKKGTIKLKDGKVNINIGTADKPGFRQLKVSAIVEGKEYKNQVNLAFSPHLIETTQAYPSDFESFWIQSVAEVREKDFKTTLTHLPEYSTEKVDVYLFHLSNESDKKSVYGYLCKPRAEGKYPVLFAPPGAGVKQIKPYLGFAKDGYISLSIEIHGINPMLDKNTFKQISGAFGKYMVANLDKKEDYYYKNVYLSCVKCVDYLCTLPEFDGKNVFVTGGSQGGALSIITTALNDKVTALVAFYPALCDLSGYAKGRAGGWPHMFKNTESLTDERLETSAYYDVVNFARMIRVPGFYSWGYNDRTCCPSSVYAAYNVITAPKENHITPISGHWRFGETNRKSLDFLKSQCK